MIVSEGYGMMPMGYPERANVTSRWLTVKGPDVNRHGCQQEYAKIRDIGKGKFGRVDEVMRDGTNEGSFVMKVTATNDPKSMYNAMREASVHP